MRTINFLSGSIKQKEMKWSLLWITLSLLFGFALYLTQGKEPCLQFLSGFILEKSLSLDNLFVIALTFSTFSVPVAHQDRVLKWGIAAILLFRFLMILGGIFLWHHISWIHHVFGVLLLLTALRMAAIRLKPITPENHPLIAFAMKRNWVSEVPEKDYFFIKKKNRYLMTPLFVMLILVISSNLLFALDSIPAIFSITQDPFIIATSNLFAILGLRSLYFVVASWMHRFFYFKVSLVILLVLIAIKMFAFHILILPTSVSLLIILITLGIGLLASFASKGTDAPLLPSPLAEEVEEITSATAKQIQRLFIIALGLAILLIGMAMIVLPGPAIIVIPLGLAILAHEFPPAKRLLSLLIKTFKKVWKYFIHP